MWLLLVLACGPGNTTSDDVDELLDRIEVLERQVADLGGVADVDSDGDGFRDGDGLPVGTRRGDVLFDVACPDDGGVVTYPDWFRDMPLVPTRWEGWSNDAADGSLEWKRWEGAIHGALLDDGTVAEADCTGSRRRWLLIAL